MARPDRRLVVFAHFDPDGRIAPHARRSIASLAASATTLIVVSTGALADDERRWVEARAQLIVRPNVGHDFVSYRVGLEAADLREIEEVVLCNDSVVFTVPLLDEMLDGRERSGADVWGLTPGYGFARHLQSYFLVFGPDALRSRDFRRFWDEVRDLGSRDAVISDYEVGLSQRMLDAGLRLGAYFSPTRTERFRGAARVSARDLSADVRARRWRRVAGRVRRLPAQAARPEWNVTAALADRALSRRPRLPVVKLSTLREDPYGLGAGALLSALERRHPDEMIGVREYLARTTREPIAVDLAPAWARYRR